MSIAKRALDFVDGLSRCAKERYEVRLLDRRSGATRVVASPRGSFYADPFVVRHADATWLFCEAFHCAGNRGYIAAARIGDDLEMREPARVLDPGCHTSFPFVFEHGGTLYLVPETSRGGSVELYACDAMPDRWRLAARLLEGVDCADSVLYLHEGVWYLVTSQAADRGSSSRGLAIYCAESPLSPRWGPHPVNRERRYADRSHGYGRNAGAIVADGSDLLRPMQASTRYYGEAARVMRIVELTPERFEETPYKGDHVLSRIAATHSTHHISVTADIVAWDTRTHTGYFRREHA